MNIKKIFNIKWKWIYLFIFIFIISCVVFIILMSISFTNVNNSQNPPNINKNQNIKGKTEILDNKYIYFISTKTSEPVDKSTVLSDDFATIDAIPYNSSYNILIGTGNGPALLNDADSNNPNTTNYAGDTSGGRIPKTIVCSAYKVIDKKPYFFYGTYDADSTVGGLYYVNTSYNNFASWSVIGEGDSSDTLISNDVNSIAINSKNDIYVAGSGGITICNNSGGDIMNPITVTKRYKNSSFGSVSKLYFDNNDRLYVCCENGLYIEKEPNDLNSGFICYKSNINYMFTKSLSSNEVLNIIRIKNELLICTDNGLDITKISDNNYSNLKFNTFFLNGVNIFYSLFAENNFLLIGSSSSTVFTISYDDIENNNIKSTNEYILYKGSGSLMQRAVTDYYNEGHQNKYCYFSIYSFAIFKYPFNIFQKP